jgi:DNA-directed RNA polymerase sigma subunit (sigma70/sigma32)
MVEKINKFLHIYKELSQGLDHEPTLEKIAKKM